jgi:hypothetical protein
MKLLTTCALLLLLVLIRVPAHAGTTTGVCVLPVGLYGRRQTLKEQYSEQVLSGYPSHKEAADHIKAQLGVVDQKYRTLMSTLCGAANNGNGDIVDQCCAETDHDPLAGQMCNLARYLADQRGDAKRFVQAFPETPQEIERLWDLDQISNGPRGLVIKECGPISAVDLNVDKLFDLVAVGDRQALQKFVNLSQHAEGVYAEGLADRIKRLFVEKPRLVLDRWSVIRQFPGIQEICAEFVDDEQATAERNFHNICAAPSQACAEVERAISCPRD